MDVSPAESGGRQVEKELSHRAMRKKGRKVQPAKHRFPRLAVAVVAVLVLLLAGAAVVLMQRQGHTDERKPIMELSVPASFKIYSPTGLTQTCSLDSLANFPTGLACEYEGDTAGQMPGSPLIAGDTVIFATNGGLATMTVTRLASGNILVASGDGGLVEDLR